MLACTKTCCRPAEAADTCQRLLKTISIFDDTGDRVNMPRRTMDRMDEVFSVQVKRSSFALRRQWQILKIGSHEPGLILLIAMMCKRQGCLQVLSGAHAMAAVTHLHAVCLGKPRQDHQ